MRGGGTGAVRDNNIQASLKAVQTNTESCTLYAAFKKIYQRRIFSKPENGMSQRVDLFSWLLSHISWKYCCHTGYSTEWSYFRNRVILWDLEVRRQNVKYFLNKLDFS